MAGVARRVGARRPGRRSVAAIGLGGQVGQERPPAAVGGEADHSGQAGLGEHARHRGDQAKLARLVAQPASQGDDRLQDEVVERAAGEGHAAGEGRGARRVEPELALLHAHRGREARVELGQSRARAAADPMWCSAARPSTAMAGQALQAAPRRERHRARAVQRDVGEEPALGRDARRRAPARPSRSAARRTGRPSTGWRASGCRDRRAGGCPAPAWRSPPRCGARGRRPRGCGRPPR